MQFSFGPFRADRSQYQAYRGDRSLELTPKLLDLLFYLLERPATLVTKEELLDGVWPGANVTENAVAQAVSDLRDALGDSPASPRYIRTVARRGYRFVGDVRRVDHVAAPATNAARPAETARPSPSPPPASGPDSAPAPAAIAVPDFTNVNGDPDVTWLASGIAETVTSDLASLDRFRVVDRWRVVQAARAIGTAEGVAPPLHELAAALGVTFIVAGSYQRRGRQLRITARLLNLDTGEAVADAKVDGDLDDIFALEDGIVSAFAAELDIPRPIAARGAARETSSLDAYRAYTEGWLKIESLDTDLIQESAHDFERAIQLDPGYPMALTGLANAEFVAYEMTRVSGRPDVAARASGIEHARRAIRLDTRLAEAHATLSFLLVSAAAFDEARAAGERAVALEPENWRHYYRLGHASWGQARLRALERALNIYPGFSYAHFELAMLHVARGRLDLAGGIARNGVEEQVRQARAANRFPAIGFHWLSGALAAADGRSTDAIEHFDRELSHVNRRRLYGPEYAATALVSRAHVELALGNAEQALASCQSALGYVPGYVRALVGQAAALRRLDRREAEEGSWRAVREAEEGLSRTGRAGHALMSAACRAAVQDSPSEAVASLNELLRADPPSFIGWYLPIEPCLVPLAGRDDFQAVLATLAKRAA